MAYARFFEADRPNETHLEGELISLAVSNGSEREYEQVIQFRRAVGGKRD